jgi:hypothetical protein
MKRYMMIVALATVAAVPAPAQTTATTVTGYVLDSACAFLKNLAKPISKDCAVACAKAGSPLVILGEDGTIYLPISDQMPATGQNERLLKLAGEKIVARGNVFERGGSHAIVIEEIHAAPPAK